MIPLRPEDIDALARLDRPRWKRRLLGTAATLGALVVTVAHSIVADSVCTSACNTLLSYVAGVLVLGVMGVVAWSPSLGTAFAAAFVVVVAVDDLMNPAFDWPAWLYVLDLGLVAVCVAGVRLPWAAGAAGRWLSATTHLRPPAPRPARAPRDPDLARFAAWLLLAVALVGGATAWGLQRTMDARQRAAWQVVAQVEKRADDDAILVRLPDGSRVVVSVESASDYPVDGTIRLYVDDRGLRQPVREPYNLSMWLTTLAIMGGLGLGLLARRWAVAQTRRRLFGRDQPVCQVVVRRYWGSVFIYPAGSGPEEEARLTYPYPGGDPPGADSDLAPVQSWDLVPAQLYGVPAAGRWCVAVVDGLALTPSGPLRRVAPGPVPEPDENGVDDESTVDESDDDFLFPRLEPEEIAKIDPADRDADPRTVLLHRQHPAVGYLAMAALALLSIGSLPRMSMVQALTVAASIQAGACLFAWWMIMRSRLAWNGAGLAAIDHGHSVRVRWDDVYLILEVQQAVQVFAGTVKITVGGIWLGRFTLGVPGTSRDAESVVLALEYARERHHDRRDELASIEPPRLPAPHPPVLLYVYWLVGTVLLTLLLR